MAACEARAADLSQTLAGLLGPNLQIKPGSSEPADVNSLLERHAVPGVVLTLTIDSQAALLLVPDVDGNLKQTFEQAVADSSGSVGLAEKIAALILPSTVQLSSADSVYVPDLSTAIRQAELQAELARIEFSWQTATQQGTMEFVWPATNQDSSQHGNDPHRNEPAEPVLEPTAGIGLVPELQRDASSRVEYADVEDGLAQLPCYSRSLLKIKVPVMVTLAESRQPVENVLNIGPGSIIHFNKPCEDTLTLEVAGQKIAVGEAVKVGDKFGLWITSMILPEERFWVLSGRNPVERAK